MTSVNKKIPAAGACCVLAVASLYLVAGCGTERPTTDRPAALTTRPVSPTTAPTARRKRPKRGDVALKVGQMAPDFELYTLEHTLAKQSKTSEKVRLSSFRRKRPVYLIFASYT